MVLGHVDGNFPKQTLTHFALTSTCDHMFPIPGDGIKFLQFMIFSHRKATVSTALGPKENFHMLMLTIGPLHACLEASRLSLVSRLKTKIASMV